MADGTYICKHCGEDTPSSEFYYRKNGVINSYKCKKCIIEASKEWSDRHPERVIENKRKNMLKTRYNITIEDWNRMFTEQTGCCAICGIHETELPEWGNYTKLCVDHDHDTGKVRGLLCNACNQKVDWYKGFKESINDYLKEN